MSRPAARESRKAQAISQQARAHPSAAVIAELGVELLAKDGGSDLAADREVRPPKNFD